MKTFVIMEKETFIVPVDLLSETASEEIKSMLSQGFTIVQDSLKASSAAEALKLCGSDPTSVTSIVKVSTSSATDNKTGLKGAVFNERIGGSTTMKPLIILLIALILILFIVIANSTTKANKECQGIANCDEFISLINNDANKRMMLNSFKGQSKEELNKTFTAWKKMQRLGKQFFDIK